MKEKFKEKKLKEKEEKEREIMKKQQRIAELQVSYLAFFLDKTQKWRILKAKMKRFNHRRQYRTMHPINRSGKYSEAQIQISVS